MSEDIQIRFSDRQNKIEPKALPRRSGNRSAKVPNAQPVFNKMFASTKPSWGGYGRDYLQRGEEGKQLRGFDAERDGVDLEDRMGAWQKAGDPEFHHVIISPERGKDLQLATYTREVVERWESDLGRKLEWAAIEHHDKPQSHVHMVVRDKNAEGKKQLLTNYYIGYGRGKDIAEQVATNHLGYRLEHQAIERRSLTLGHEAYTETDKALIQKADARGVVNLEKEQPANGVEREKLEQERKRLTYLADIGMAKQVNEQEWKLDPKLPQEMRFRGANREHAPAWRKSTSERPVQRLEQQRLFQAIESERIQDKGRER